MPYFRGMWLDDPSVPVAPEWNPMQARIDERYQQMNPPVSIGQNFSGPNTKPQTSWQPYSGVVDDYPSYGGPVQIGTPFSGPSVKPPNGWQPYSDPNYGGPPVVPGAKPTVDPVLAATPATGITTKPAVNTPVAPPTTPAGPVNPRASRRAPVFSPYQRMNTFRFK